MVFIQISRPKVPKIGAKMHISPKFQSQTTLFIFFIEGYDSKLNYNAKKMREIGERSEE